MQQQVAAVAPAASQAFSGNRAAPILRTAAALLSVQGVTWASALVGILVVPRFLGSSGLGLLASAGTLAATIAMLATFGTAPQTVKAVARDPQAAASVFVHVVFLRLAIWSASTLVVVLVAFTLVDDRLTRFVVVASLGTTGIALVGTAATAALQGNQTLGRAAVAAAVIGVVSQMLTVAILVLGGGLVPLMVFSLIVAPVAAAVPVALFWKRLGGDVRWSRGLALSLLSGGIPFVTWDLSLRLYGSIDYLLLAFLTDTRTVGEYAFAHRLAAVPIFGATIVGTAIYPAMAAAAVKDFVFFRQLLANGSRVVVLATFPMAAGLIALAPELTQLIGGGQFHRANPLVVILALHIPLVAIDTVLGTALFAMDRQRGVAVAGGVAALLNPIVNVAAIPLSVSWFGSGAVGAAVVTVATECFVGTWIWLMLGNNIDRRANASLAGLTLVACLVMAVAVRLSLPFVGTFGAVAVGAVVYAVAVVGLRLVRVAEARQLRTAFSSS